MAIWLAVLALILAPAMLAIVQLVRFFLADQEWQPGGSYGRQLVLQDERERPRR